MAKIKAPISTKKSIKTIVDELNLKIVQALNDLQKIREEISRLPLCIRQSIPPSNEYLTTCQISIVIIYNISRQITVFAIKLCLMHFPEMTRRELCSDLSKILDLINRIRVYTVPENDLLPAGDKDGYGILDWADIKRMVNFGVRQWIFRFGS